MVQTTGVWGSFWMEILLAYLVIEAGAVRILKLRFRETKLKNYRENRMAD